MAENASEPKRLGALLQKLSSEDALQRQEAREQLVEIGGPTVTRELVAALSDPDKQVRWEAAKALTGIADPVAAPGLMHALEDDDQDVRWLAGEGLIALGRSGLMTVLSGLMRRARSLDFCKGAHHVLHDLKTKGYGEIVEPVLKSLETSQPEVTAPVAAYEALVALKQQSS